VSDRRGDHYAALSFGEGGADSQFFNELTAICNTPWPQT
jgi:hypothetical protein